MISTTENDGLWVAQHQLHPEVIVIAFDKEAATIMCGRVTAAIEAQDASPVQLFNGYVMWSHDDPRSLIVAPGGDIYREDKGAKTIEIIEAHLDRCKDITQ